MTSFFKKVSFFFFSQRLTNIKSEKQFCAFFLSPVFIAVYVEIPLLKGCQMEMETPLRQMCVCFAAELQ